MQRLLNTKGKILSIDYGDTRTGLAVCDATRFLASGIGTISPGGMQKTVDAICEKVVELRITGGIIVGLPVNMNGTEGPRAEHCRKFAAEIERRLGDFPGYESLPIVMLDERMTTMVAARYLNETDTRGAKRKGVIDTLSAQIILQNALDRLKNMK